MNKNVHMKIAERLMATANNLGKTYTTADERLGDHIATLLTIMVTCTTPQEVDEIVNTLIKTDKRIHPEADLWIFLCLCVNWLSWAWFEEGGHEQLSEAWANNWYKIHDHNLESRKGDDLKYYLKEVD